MKVLTMLKRFFSLFALTLLMTGIAPVLAQPMRPGGEGQFIAPKPPLSSDIPGGEAQEGWPSQLRRRPGRGGRPEFREEQRRRLERARDMAQRLLDNPNTPDDIKAKARQLTELLDKRENLVRDLDGKRQSFLQEHGPDIDELRQLRERGEVIRQKLRVARETVISENLPTLQEMRRTTREARDTALELRNYYRQRWRSQRRSALPGTEQPALPGEE
ncbi:MAG TPA: hypothetical protein VKK81_06805 [Candidatus Binatia bacterium]|nr:hypothetical protein [Candidatus Binatia bacterium]